MRSRFAAAVFFYLATEVSEETEFFRQDNRMDRILILPYSVFFKYPFG